MSLKHPDQKRAAAPTPQSQDDNFIVVPFNTSSPTPTLSPTAGEPSITITPQQTIPTTQSDPGSDTDKDLVNMYFLILGALAAILIGGVWFWRRGKRRKQLESTGRRQNALQQDLELGRQRGVGGTGAAGFLGLSRREREEEGLNERGEAPPPYTADALLAEGQVMVVPERAHVREGSGALPKYEEVRESPGRTPESELPEVEPTRADEGGEPIPNNEEAGHTSTPGIIRSRDVTD